MSEMSADKLQRMLSTLREDNRHMMTMSELRMIVAMAIRYLSDPPAWPRDAVDLPREARALLTSYERSGTNAPGALGHMYDELVRVLSKPRNPDNYGTPTEGGWYYARVREWRTQPAPIECVEVLFPRPLGGEPIALVAGDSDPWPLRRVHQWLGPVPAITVKES